MEHLKKNSYPLFEVLYIDLVLHFAIQVHIEQGPVLESVGLPLGVVKGIAGQTRLKVCVTCGLGLGLLSLFCKRMT